VWCVWYIWYVYVIYMCVVCCVFCVVCCVVYGVWCVWRSLDWNLFHCYISKHPLLLQHSPPESYTYLMWVPSSSQECDNPFWPLTKFWRILGHIWPLLGLRQLAKEGAQREVESKEARPVFGSILGFWVDVMGKECWPVGLPTLRPIL